eukprot:403339712
MGNCQGCENFINTDKKTEYDDNHDTNEDSLPTPNKRNDIRPKKMPDYAQDQLNEEKMMLRLSTNSLMSSSGGSQQQSIYQQKIQKNGKYSLANDSNSDMDSFNKQSSKTYKNSQLIKHESYNQQKVQCAIKLQSYFRMIVARFKFKEYLKQSGKLKYFTIDEFWETLRLDKSAKFNLIEPKKKRQYLYACSGAVYIGDWRGNFRDGYGQMKWPDGASYEGYWKDNHANGVGKFSHTSGDVYEGDWIRDKANGNGVYKSKDGGIYRGEWLNDQQNGRGVEVWTDGSSYDGDYVKGMKEGLGSYKWPNGSTYVGYWKRNMINGVGIQKWVDGRIYEGEFKDNLMNGLGFYTFADGKTYIGYYINDKKEGYGIYTWSDGKCYQGWWTQGKQDGLGIFTQSDGSQKIGVWQDGKKLNWLTIEQIGDIDRNFIQAQKSGQFKKANNEQLERMHYQVPKDFEKEKGKIREKVSRIIDITKKC